MTLEKRVLTVEETAKVLGIGINLAYDQIRAGIIPALKLGRIYRIPVIELNKFMSRESVAKKEVPIEKTKRKDNSEAYHK